MKTLRYENDGGRILDKPIVLQDGSKLAEVTLGQVIEVDDKTARGLLKDGLFVDVTPKVKAKKAVNDPLIDKAVDIVEPKVVDKPKDGSI
jgi:hypothetical protein